MSKLSTREVTLLIQNQRGMSAIGLIVSVCLLFGLWWFYNLFTTAQQVSDLTKRLDVAANSKSDDEVLLISGYLIQLPSSAVTDYLRSNVYNTRGCAFLRRGNNKDAMACFESAMQYNPQNPSPYYNKGLIFERFNDEGNAAAMYKKFLQLSGDTKDEFTERAKKFLE